jgi:meso-butanediol dehydrogenase/(S,S)-butanediol dehydrogenase/diacetyl reductase
MCAPRGLAAVDADKAVGNGHDDSCYWTLRQVMLYSLPMTGRVAGKGIVVTGAGSGVGRAIALGLAGEGATLGVVDINADAAGRVAAEIAALPDAAPALALGADVSERSEVAAALDVFVAHTGRLDVMFNNAGLNRPMRLLDVTEDNWHSIMDVNALGTLIGIQEAAKRMIPYGSGKIVNTSSIAGRQGYPSFAPYSASKFAVNALTQAAARALAEHNITCTAFAPGVVDTPLWTQLDADLQSIGDAQRPGQAMAEFAAGILRGRPAVPEDLVGTAVFLASADSDYITGQVIMADGGMVLV